MKTKKQTKVEYQVETYWRGEWHLAGLFGHQKEAHKYALEFCENKFRIVKVTTTREVVE